MPRFSKRSLDNLAQAHPLLQRVAHEAIKSFDFTVICGYRGRAEQEKAYKSGASKARFGQSPHNFTPSRAIDIVPYPLDWNNIRAFEDMGVHFTAAAKRLGIPVTWGKKFAGLVDYPHFELADWRNVK